jgi:hypothetical protein
MKPAAKDLIRAILSRLRELDTTAGKTKVLKLSYLADIEHVRTSGETLTGFDWIFFLYGPWAKDFDEAIAQLEAEGAVERRPWVQGDIEGEGLIGKDSADLNTLIRNTEEYFRTRRLIETFSRLSTPELLDYIYFETEPMQGAEKLKSLDFGKVSKQAPQLYRRKASGAPPARVKELQRAWRDIKERVEREANSNIANFWTPTHDEHYIKALEVLNRPGEE